MAADDDQDLDGRPGPRPLITLVRRWPWAAPLLAANLVLRIVAVAGIHLYRYYDSAEYDTLDFSGRYRRPWATPLLYSLFPTDQSAPVVLAQALLGLVAWSLLALSAAAWFRHRVVQGVVAAVIVAVSLTTSITNWDTAKLSESLSLSLTALLVAAWLAFARRPRWATAAMVVAATFPWLFVRQSLLPTGWLLACGATVAAVFLLVRRGRRSPALAPVAVLAVVLLGCNVLATASYARNQQIVNLNLTVIIANRMAPHPDRVAWFLDHGMPRPASGAYDYTSLDQDPTFQRWIRDEGTGTYADFLLSHPWYSLTSPLDDLVSQRPSYQEVPPIAEKTRILSESMLSPGDAYGSSRPVLPGPVEQVLFAPADTGAIVFLLALTVAWTLWRRGYRDRRGLVAAAIAGCALVSFYAAWHGATPELPRLAIVPATLVRLALVFQLAMLAEGELARRRRTGAAGAAAYSRPR